MSALAPILVPISTSSCPSSSPRPPPPPTSLYSQKTIPLLMMKYHSPPPKPPHNPMHNRNILPLNIIHHHLPHLRLPPAIPQKQQVPPLKRWLHAPRQYYYDGRGRIGRDGQTFPQHEGGREDEGEVKYLGEELAGLEGGEGGKHFLLYS